ncbi:MAG: glycosyltransferase family 39 protein [Myxococcota bacterium]|nr:glycosyltransferase family 39 protein [Myxococcota bacterium]
MAANVPSEQRLRLGLLLLAGVVFLGVRVPLLGLPLERDEGEYAYVAWRMLEGELPYRDAFDQKPPAVFAVYLGTLLLGGHSAWAIHAALLVWSAGTAWALHGLVRRLAGGLPAAIAVLVFALAAADPMLGATAANTELFMLLPMVGALLAALRALEGEGWWWWLLSGALGAAACWFKQVAALNALFVVLLAAVLPPARGERSVDVLAGRLGWLTLGAVAVSLPVFAVFATAGALEPFLDAVFLHNVEYAQQRTLSEGLDNLAWNLLRQAPGLATVWGLAGLGLLVPDAGRRARALLGGWLLFSGAGVAVGIQFRPHYFVQALPALSALAGLGGAGLIRRSEALGPVPRALAPVGLVALLLVPGLLARREALFAGSSEAAARTIYGMNPFPESPAIARYIERTSEPHESVFVVGSEPQILFHARRPSATRYIFFYPLTGSYPDALERQREAMAQVRASRPRYVVWAHLSTSLLTSAETEPWIFEATDEMLRRHYRLEFVMRPDDTLRSYERVDGDAAVRWIRRHRAGASGLPWIGVHRRVP